MGYGDYSWGLYNRDPFPHSLLSTKNQTDFVAVDLLLKP